MPRYTAIIDTCKVEDVATIIEKIESTFKKSDEDGAASVDCFQDLGAHTLNLPADFFKSPKKYQVECFFTTYRASPKTLKDLEEGNPGVRIFEEEGKLFARTIRDSSISLGNFKPLPPVLGSGTHVIIVDTPISDTSITLASKSLVSPDKKWPPGPSHGDEVARTIHDLAPGTSFHSIEYAPSDGGPSVVEALTVLWGVVQDLEGEGVNRDSIVVNMSWGVKDRQNGLNVVEDFFATVFAVAAAGNGDYCPGQIFPANVKTVMTVGAIDENMTESDESSPGPQVDIFTLGKTPSGWSGTSFAAARITGLALQAKSMFQPLDVQRTRQVLLSNASHDVHLRPRSVARARAFGR